MKPTKWDRAFFEKIGYKVDRLTRTPLMEDNDQRQGLKRVRALFIKFMSDGGLTDNAQGRRFTAFLEKNKVPFEQGSTPRHFVWVEKVPLEQALGMKIEGFDD